MKSIFTTVSFLSILGLLVWFPIYAADTGTISATVTAQNVAVSVSDGTVAYGTIALSSTQDTTSGNLNDSQTATNDGNVNSTLNVKTSNATTGTAWTVGASIGSDTYVHEFSTTTGSFWEILDTADTYETASSSFAAGDDSIIDLRMNTPSATTDYQQKSITVTVQIVAN